MILILVCAITASAGASLVAVAITPRRRSLGFQLDELLGPTPTSVIPKADQWGSFGNGLLAAVSIDRDRFPQLVKDLTVTDGTLETFFRRIVMTAAIFILISIALFSALALEGLTVGHALAVGMVLLTGGLGAILPRATLRGQAAERRVEMREAVAVICDLAAVLVAAGEDVDAAVVTATSTGAGWAFDAVRTCLPVSGRRGTWVAVEGLGAELGVDELVILAQNMGLAEEKGAKVREALNAQAKTLREEAASEVEAKAGSMTERMSFPMVMLLAGFLLVIGYPAVARL